MSNSISALQKVLEDLTSLIQQARNLPLKDRPKFFNDSNDSINSTFKLVEQGHLPQHFLRDLLTIQEQLISEVQKLTPQQEQITPKLKIRRPRLSKTKMPKS